MKTMQLNKTEWTALGRGEFAAHLAEWAGLDASNVPYGWTALKITYSGSPSEMDVERAQEALKDVQEERL